MCKRLGYWKKAVCLESCFKFLSDYYGAFLQKTISRLNGIDICKVELSYVWRECIRAILAWKSFITSFLPRQLKLGDSYGISFMVLICFEAVYRWLLAAASMTSSVMANWGLAMVDVLHWLLQVVVVLLPELHDSILAVQPLPYNFIRLHELVDFPRQFIVLVADHANVIVHGVNLDLEIGIVFKEGTVRVASAFELFSHVKQLILLLSDFHL